MAASGDDKRPKSLIDKAMDGTASATDFKDFIMSFISDQNTLNSRSTSCTLSKPTLDFQQDGHMVPVVSYEEMETSEKYVSDSVTLTNNGKIKVYYEVLCKPNPKFKLLVDNPLGTLAKGKSVQIKFNVQVYCTTKVYQMLKIAVYKDKPRNFPDSRTFKRDFRAGVFHKVRTAEQSAQEMSRLWVAFKLESELSKQIDWDEIEIGAKLAKGGFGTVFKGTWRGSEVAVKILNTQELVDEEKDAVKREMVLMAKLASPHMVTYMGSTMLPTMPWSIVMEFVSGGSLTDLLKKHNSNMSLHFKIKLLQDIVAGMQYLHAHSIFHRDIKPDNMLVVSAHEAAVNLKITDFGTSKASAKKGGLETYEAFNFDLIQAKEKEKEKANAEDILTKLNQQHADKDERVVTRGVGTLIYQAPEILDGKDSLQIDKTDVYAFGILMWEMWTAAEPYSIGATAKFSKWDLETYVKGGNRPEIPSELNTQFQDYRDLITECWDQNPRNRPTFSDIAKRLKILFEKYDGELGVRKPQNDNSSSGGYSSSHKGASASTPVATVVLSPSGVPTPTNGLLSDIGWGNDMDRPDAERRLQGSHAGTFILRWSRKTLSYVLTYSKGNNSYQHIAFIQPVKPDFVKIQVDKEDGQKQEYDDLFAYVRAMKESGIITTPCRNNMPGSELQQGQNLYSHTPGF